MPIAAPYSAWSRATARLFAALLGLLFSAATLAANSFTLVPSAARVDAPVVLQIDSTLGCYRAESVTVHRSGQRVAVRFILSDVAECEAGWVTPRDIPLGSFARGAYQVTITECVNAPVDPCTLRQTLALSVGTAQPTAIEATSWRGLAALFCLVLLLGAVLLRR